MTHEMTAPLKIAAPGEVAEVVFDETMQRKIDTIRRRYPATHTGAAVLPVLWLCQEKWGWISPGIMRAAAGMTATNSFTSAVP